MNLFDPMWKKCIYFRIWLRMYSFKTINLVLLHNFHYLWWVQIFAIHPIYWFVFSQFHRFWAHTWVFLARNPKQGSRSIFLYLSFSQKHCKDVWYDSGWHHTHTIGLPQRKHWKLKWLILNNEYKENTTKGAVPFWSER